MRSCQSTDESILCHQSMKPVTAASTRNGPNPDPRERTNPDSIIPRRRSTLKSGPNRARPRSNRRGKHGEDVAEICGAWSSPRREHDWCEWRSQMRGKRRAGGQWREAGLACLQPPTPNPASLGSYLASDRPSADLVPTVLGRLPGDLLRCQLAPALPCHPRYMPP